MPRATLRRWCSAAALMAGAFACTDQGPEGSPDSARIVGGAQRFAVSVGDVVDFRLECLSRNGRVIRGAPAAWAVNNPRESVERPGRVALDFNGGRARVRGVSEGPVDLVGGCLESRDVDLVLQSEYFYGSPLLRHVRVDVLPASDTAWILDGPSDTLRLRAPTADDTLSDVTQLLTTRNAVGAPHALDPIAFNWSSDDEAIATISSEGLVRARVPGVTTVRVQRRSRTLPRPVRVENAPPSSRWDISLVDAHWTQGAQDEAQRIPMIRNGRAAAVNVLAHATPNAPASSVSMQVWNAAGQSVWSQRVPLAPTVGGAPSFGAPSAQFLVPRIVLRVAASWRVTLDTNSDTGAAYADASASNDRWPRSGTLALAAITAPTLHLRLVPLRVASHNNYSVPLTPESRVFYDSIARIRLPLGEVVVSIEPPLTVQSRVATVAELAVNQFADEELWREALDAVDARRVASGAKRSDYWIGVLPKPTAESSSRIGGRAFIPANARDNGPMSRSMLVRGHDWYPTPVRTGFVVAHEIGHTLGLRHAPCGGAGGPDPAYPVAGGGVGNWVHWVSTWEHGSAALAATIAPTVGDFMGYCSSYFVGPFHYRAMLAWRATADEAFAMAPSSTRVLAVRGWLTERGITLGRPEVIEAERIDGAGSSILVEILAADGRVLASGWARSGQLSDGTAIPFVAHLPLSAGVERVMASVRASRGTLRESRATSRP